MSLWETLVYLVWSLINSRYPGRACINPCCDMKCYCNYETRRIGYLLILAALGPKAAKAPTLLWAAEYSSHSPKQYRAKHKAAQCTNFGTYYFGLLWTPKQPNAPTLHCSALGCFGLWEEYSTGNLNKKRSIVRHSLVKQLWLPSRTSPDFNPTVASTYARLAGVFLRATSVQSKTWPLLWEFYPKP